MALPSPPLVGEPEPRGTRKGDKGKHESCFTRVVWNEVKGDTGASGHCGESRKQEGKGAPGENPVTLMGGLDDRDKNPQEDPF